MGTVFHWRKFIKLQKRFPISHMTKLQIFSYHLSLLCLVWVAAMIELQNDL